MALSRRLRWLGVAWLLAAAAACPARAQAGPDAPSPSAPPAVDVSADLASQALDPSLAVLEDPSGGLSLEAVRALPGTQWTAPRALPLNPGYSLSVWWLRVRLHNASREAPQAKFLQLRSALQDYVRLSIVQGDGRVHTFAGTGDREPFGRRPMASLTPVFPLDLGPGETAEVFVRLATHDGLHEQVGLVVWERAAFGAASEARALACGVYYGLGGVLLVYSAFMFMWLRHRVFATYCGYLLSILAWSATYNGHSLRYLWPESPGLNNQILPLAMSGAFLFGLMFTADLLQLERALPRCDRALRRLGVAIVVAATPALFNFYSLTFALSLPLGVTTSLVQLACGAVLAVRGSRQALWFVLAWGPLVFSALMAVLEMTGLASPHAWTADALILGAGFQVLVLGIGLADAADRVRRDKLAIEHAARLAQESLAARLEAQVKGRTAELERANERLQALAITDALTGAFNRRYFNEALEAAIGRARPGPARPALCLIDVDHFKAYNDLYGHAKGDKVLISIAATLRGGLRRAGDHAFRVGGEEFALILQPDALHAQRDHVEALRHAIESLRLPHAGHAAGVVTASFGLVQMPAREESTREVSASALYREADRLLYRAKENGRNRVESAVQPVTQWAASTDFSSEPGPAGA